MPTLAEFRTFKKARIARLRLQESDFEELFTCSSGPGGQNVNKVATSVTVRHRPTGTSATSQDSRSQSMNRQMAWQRIFEALERAVLAARAEARAAKEKERRRNAPRPWGLKQRILRDKKKRSETKTLRRKEC